MRGAVPGSAAFAPEAPDGRLVGWGVVSVANEDRRGRGGAHGNCSTAIVRCTVLGTEGIYALLHEGTQSQGSHHKTSEKENGMGVKMKWAKGVK